MDVYCVSKIYAEYQELANIHFPLKESPRWFKRNGGLV